MAHVFISYSHDDIDFAEKVSMKLAQVGVEVWDMRLIQAGDEWGQEIDQAIRSADAVIVIMSPSAKRSDYVTYEWSFTLGAALPVIPIMLRKTKLHPRLEILHRFNFTGTQRPWDKLIEHLATLRHAAAAGTSRVRDLSPLRWLSVEVSPMVRFQDDFMMMQLWVRNESDLEAQAVRASMTWRRSDDPENRPITGSIYWTIKNGSGYAGYKGVSEVVDLYSNRDPQHLAFVVREVHGARVYIASTDSATHKNWQHPGWLVGPGTYDVDIQFDAMKARRAKVALSVVVQPDGEVIAQVKS